MSKPEIVFLLAKTRKGKSRRDQFGCYWQVLQTKDRVSFTTMPGPWLLIKPEFHDDGIRWVHRQHDADFIVETVFPAKS